MTTTTPPTAPMSEEAIQGFATFINAVAGRLEAGRAVYGDVSFTRPPSELAGEIEQELLDVAGWAFVLWTRVRRLREKVTP